MDKIQSLIIDTYNEKPKHFTQILKRNKEVMQYIKDIVPVTITSFLEQLYYSIYRDAGICINGNKKKLKSFEGYSFCGRTGICQCAKESVSKGVSKTKQEYSKDKKIDINFKRITTTLKKYGVTNNGQTTNAKNLHQKFYENKLDVDEITKKTRLTKFEKYNDENYNNREKTEITCLEKYGVNNVNIYLSEKNNPKILILKDKVKLSELYPKYSVSDIAVRLEVSEGVVYRYLNEHGFREPYKSTFEKEIIYFLTELGVTNIITNKRNIIGKEIDIFLPDHNLAIEFNGIYWHHDKIQHITKTYHKDKFELCENRGIELFTIFSDSWETKKEVWKNKIRAKLGMLNKIYARNTEIVKLSVSETREILDKYHTQGYCVSQICYGLRYNDTIVAVMTFSEKRAGIGKKKVKDQYELVRYVTSATVLGGASKLLKHFIKNHNATSIISYSDNRYSIGNLYKILGFTLSSLNVPGYWYYNPANKKSYHRYNFTKYKLVEMGHDPNKTEKEIMDNLGYLRIWDCGSRTWILNC